MTFPPNFCYPKNTRPLLLCAVVFIALGLYHWNYLFSFPGWFVDEALTASRIKAFTSFGNPPGVIEREATFGEGNGALFVPALPYLAFSVPLTLFPSMEIIEGLRVSSYAAGMLLLAAVGVIAWRLISPMYGAVAMAICGSSVVFSSCSHVARPDVLAAAVGFWGLALYGGRPIAAFLSFFLTTFSIAFHQRGIILLAALMAMVLVDAVSRKFPRLNFLMALGGGVLGLIGFYLGNIFFFSSLALFWGMNRWMFSFSPPPVVGAGAGDWVGILSTLKGTSLICYPSAGLFIFLSIVFLLLAGPKRVNPKLSVMILVGLIAGALLMNGLIVVKLVMVSPFLDLAVTSCFATALSLAAAHSRWMVPALSMSIWFITSISVKGFWLTLISVSKCRDEAPTTAAALQSFIPPNAKVLAEESFWIYLQNNRYQSWKDISPRMRQTGQSFSEVLRSSNSDYLIMDAGMADLVNADLSDPFFRSMGVPSEEFRRFFKIGASKVGEIPTTCYGTLTLYAINKNMIL